MNPNYIDQVIEILEEEGFVSGSAMITAMRAVQKQWAADRMAYEVLDSRYRSMRDQLFALTNQMAHEANHIHDVWEMRTK